MIHEQLTTGYGVQIRAFVNGWNKRCHPFVWTKTADDPSSRRQPLDTSTRPTS